MSAEIETHHGEKALWIDAAYHYPDLVRLMVTDFGADISQGDQFEYT
jgi:hypothetical protein